MPLHPVVGKVQQIEVELGRYMIGRQAEIHGAMLGLAARQHMFLLGPPGSGKSQLAAEIARRVRRATFFSIGLHAFVLRDELFGPIRLSALRERDALERKFAGYLPDAHLVQLDEIWKCPPATLNTMLSLLNERTFRNDDQLLRAPLVSAVVTSNELPPADRSLDPLYDRILLRYAVRPLTDHAERQRATRFSVGMRAFESAVRRAAEDLAEVRADDYRRRRDALGTADDGVPWLELDDDYLANIVPSERPDRWLIDEYGELIGSAEARAQLRAGDFASRLPEAADGAALIVRAADWLDEHDAELPYQTFLEMPDLADLHALVLETALPPATEAAFYRILDAASGISVRREAELRVLVAAEATLAGRSSAGIADLRVLAHALWDRPEMAPEVARIIESETGDVDAELLALRGALVEWQSAAAEPRTVNAKIALREQMDQELGRLDKLVDAFPDRTDLTAQIQAARTFRDRYDAAIFASDITADDEPEISDDDFMAMPAPAGGAGEEPVEADPAAEAEGQPDVPADVASQPAEVSEDEDDALISGLFAGSLNQDDD